MLVSTLINNTLLKSEVASAKIFKELKLTCTNYKQFGFLLTNITLKNI